MQKLELRNYLHDILVLLKSKEIVEFISTKGNLPKGELIRIFIDSKKGYDNSSKEKDLEYIYNLFDAESIYTTNFFSDMLAYIPTTPNENKNTFLTNDLINRFYSFHRSLINTFNIVDKILINNKELFDEKSDFNIDKAEDNGNLLLQIIDNDDVKLSKLTLVLDSCQKLIEAVYLYFDKVESEKYDLIPEINFIDSGTDININLKLPEKVTKTISKLLKEFWEFLSNNKGYQLKKKNEAVNDSLTILKKLKEAEEAKTIGSEQAEIIRRGILFNTENIVFNNTLPKILLIETKTISNRDIMLDKTKILLLEESKDKGDESATNPLLKPTA